MTSDDDLGSIAPERRAETARRIAILDRYGAIAMPDAEDDARHAEEMGVGTGQFLRIARIWRLHHRPDLLPGATTVRRERARVKIGASADARPVERLARASVVLDEVALDLRVPLSRPRALPILLVALDPEDGRVHAWRLGEGGLDASAAATLLLDLPPGGPTLVRASYAGADRTALDPLVRALADAGVGLDAAPRTGERIGTEARRLLGGRIGGVALRSRPTLRADAHGATGTLSMDMDEARLLVGRAIGRHNAALESGAPSLPTDSVLRDRLSAIAKAGSSR